MKRLVLIGLAIAIVGAGIALVVKARSDSGAIAEAAGSGKTAQAGDDTSRSGRRLDTRPSLRAHEPGSTRADSGDSGNSFAERQARRLAKSDRVPARTYVREDGTIVSDFRPAPGETRQDPGRYRPAGNSRLKREVVSGLRNAVRAPLKACTDDIPRQQLGPRGSLQADVTVSVQSGTATVTDTKMRGVGLDGGAADVIARCVQGKLSGVTVGAEGQDDVPSYTLSLPFRVNVKPTSP